MKKIILLGLCASLAFASCKKKSTTPSIHGTYTAKFDMNGVHYDLHSDVVFQYSDSNVTAGNVQNDTAYNPEITIGFRFPGTVTNADVTSLNGGTFPFSTTTTVQPQINFYPAALDSWYSEDSSAYALTISSVTDIGSDAFITDLELYKVTGSGNALMRQSSTFTEAVLNNLTFELLLCRQK